MDVACIHLDGNADSVEFCPQYPFEHILAAATYTLQESPQPCRVGSLSLFSIQDKAGLKLLQNVKTSGIFDIKWRPENATKEPSLLQADSDGNLTIYQLDNSEHTDRNKDWERRFLEYKIACELQTTKFTDDSGQGLRLRKLLGQNISCSAMCLTADWQPHDTGDTADITVALSDGVISLAILNGSQMKIKNSWKAHEFEIWSIAYDCHQHCIIYSGADDCNFCGWDTRECSSKPIFRNSKGHQMGVCSIQKCPDNENRIITGSYDEFMRIWDTRMLAKPLLKDSLSLGGGVWKLKFNPTDRNLVLAACMHNGFTIVRLEHDNIRFVEEYKRHISLAYGADWYKGNMSLVEDLWKDAPIVSNAGASKNEVLHRNNSELQTAESSIYNQHPKGRELTTGGFWKSSLVATCSFYDKALHLWFPQYSTNTMRSSCNNDL